MTITRSKYGAGPIVTGVGPFTDPPFVARQLYSPGQWLRTLSRTDQFGLSYPELAFIVDLDSQRQSPGRSICSTPSGLFIRLRALTTSTPHTTDQVRGPRPEWRTSKPTWPTVHTSGTHPEIAQKELSGMSGAGCDPAQRQHAFAAPALADASATRRIFLSLVKVIYCDGRRWCTNGGAAALSASFSAGKPNTTQQIKV